MTIVNPWLMFLRDSIWDHILHDQARNELSLFSDHKKSKATRIHLVRHTSLSTKEVSDVLTLCSGVKCTPSHPSVLLVPAWGCMQYPQLPAGGAGVWLTEHRQQDWRGCQTEQETGGGKNWRGIYFSLKFSNFSDGFGGGRFKGSDERGGLTAAEHAADCKGLVRCLLSFFLPFTSLPACPASAHGPRLIMRPEWPRWHKCTRQHTLRCACNVHAMYHINKAVQAQKITCIFNNISMCMFSLRWSEASNSL